MSNKNKFYQTKEFNKLNAEWQEVLKLSKFKDLEADRDEYLHLRTDSAKRRFTRRYANKEETIEYYTMARQYIHTGEFKNSIWKQCWELHSEGHSYRSIGKKLGLQAANVQYKIEHTRAKMRGYK